MRNIPPDPIQMLVIGDDDEDTAGKKVYEYFHSWQHVGMTKLYGDSCGRTPWKDLCENKKMGWKALARAFVTRSR